MLDTRQEVNIARILLFGTYYLYVDVNDSVWMVVHNGVGMQVTAAGSGEDNRLRQRVCTI